MNEVEPSTIAGYAGGGSAVLLAIAYSLQKFFKNFNADRAETAVVQLLREEVTRMAARNTEVINEISVLQSELLRLNHQLVEFNQENSRLKSEVSHLTDELKMLRQQIRKDNV